MSRASRKKNKKEQKEHDTPKQQETTYHDGALEANVTIAEAGAFLAINRLEGLLDNVVGADLVECGLRA